MIRKYRRYLAIFIFLIAILGLSGCNLNKNTANNELQNIADSKPNSSPVFLEDLESPGTRAAEIQEQDIIWQFFDHLNKSEIDQALAMMSHNLVADGQSRQAWQQQFEAIKSIHIQNLKAFQKDQWTENSHVYEAELEAYVAKESKQAPIPYYGWEDNPNTRWIILEKTDNRQQWLIGAISTGP